MSQPVDRPQTSRREDVQRTLDSFHADILQAVGKVVVGAENAVEQLLLSLIVGGHVLLEGVPGVAKTTLAKVFRPRFGNRLSPSPIHPPTCSLLM